MRYFSKKDDKKIKNNNKIYEKKIKWLLLKTIKLETPEIKLEAFFYESEKNLIFIYIYII